MKIYKHRVFSKWAKSEGISDSYLKQAVAEMEDGLFDANLGGGLYKKRIARKGEGKRSAYRTLVAFKLEDRAIFVFGFAKNDQQNIGVTALAFYKELAKQYFHMDSKTILDAIDICKLIEVK